MSNLTEHVANLASPEESDRAEAAEDLGYSNSPQAVAPLLERLAQEPSVFVREAIAHALMRIDGDEGLSGVIGLLASDDSQIRNLAVEVLHRKGSRAIPFLKQAMQEGNRDTRKFVVDALSGILAGGAEAIYGNALTDNDLNVVITAVENLGNLRATTFRSEIENLIQPDAHPMLIAACMEALAGIGSGSSLDAIRRCYSNLTELPTFLLKPCLKAMGALGDAKEFEQVLALVPSPAPQLYPAILSTLIQLYERAIFQRCAPPRPSDDLLICLRGLVEGHEQPPACRYQAVRVLGIWFEHEDVSGSLVNCLSSLEKMVREGAAEALRSSHRPGFEALLEEHEAREMEREEKQALGR